MNGILRAGLCALALGASPGSDAADYEYLIRYVGRVSMPDVPDYCAGRYSEPVIGCGFSADAQQFLGAFSTDVELEHLADGIYAGADAPHFHTFSTRFGGLVWDSGDSHSAFSGFRDPLLGGHGIGVIVRGGRVLGFVGGVYGALDYPYLDFFAEAGPPGIDWARRPTPRAALDAWSSRPGDHLARFTAADDRGGVVKGTYSVTRAP